MLFSPFDILEWTKEAGFEIPSALAFEIKYEDKEKKYYWIEDNASKVKTNKKPITNEIVGERIKDIIINYDSESTIAVQEPGKKIKYITNDSLELKHKHWDDFKRILENPPHNYKVGPSIDKKAYDYRQKRIKHISDMLLKNLFKKELKLSIPSSYKLYELDKTKETGTYKFKFCMEKITTTDCSGLSDENLLKEWKKRLKQNKLDPDNMQELDNFSRLTKEVKNRDLLTDKEIKDHIHPKIEKDSILSNKDFECEVNSFKSQNSTNK